MQCIVSCRGSRLPDTGTRSYRSLSFIRFSEPPFSAPLRLCGQLKDFRIAALADGPQAHPAPGARLSWHHTQESTDLPPRAKLPAITDLGEKRARGERPHPQDAFHSDCVITPGTRCRQDCESLAPSLSNIIPIVNIALLTKDGMGAPRRGGRRPCHLGVLAANCYARRTYLRLRMTASSDA